MSGALIVSGTLLVCMSLWAHYQRAYDPDVGFFALLGVGAYFAAVCVEVLG